MDKKKYLKAACKAHAWKRLSWRLTLFTVGMLPEDHKPREYDLNYPDGIAHAYVEGKWVKLDGAVPYEGLFVPEERLEVEAGDYPGLESTVASTVGAFFYQWMVSWYPFGTMFPYEPLGVEPNKMSKLLYELCTDYDDTEVSDESKVVRPKQVGVFVQMVSELSPLCLGIAPTGTLRTLETHPDLYKVRDALLEKHKDNLDANTVVMIQGVLDDLDREWLEGDQSADFFQGKKAKMRRRKLLLIHGIEKAFREDGSFELVPTSLMEGGDLTKLVEKFNSIREGSYDRGAETAKGGDQVRVVQTIFQNHQFVVGDCGVKYGVPCKINKLTLGRYVGMNEIKAGKTTRLTEDYLKTMIGKVIEIRRPFICHQNHIDCCAGCSSESKAKQGRAPATDVAAGLSNVMSASMSAMHGSDASLAEFIPEIHIT